MEDTPSDKKLKTLELKKAGNNGNYDVSLFTYDAEGNPISAKILITDMDEGGTETVETNAEGFVQHNIQFNTWDKKYSFKLLGVKRVEIVSILEGNWQAPKFDFWKGTNLTTEEIKKVIRTYNERKNNRIRRGDNSFGGPGCLLVPLAILGLLLGKSFLSDKKPSDKEVKK